MTASAHRLLKKYAVLTGSILLFFAVFFGLVYLRGKVESTPLTLAAQRLCSAYAEAEKKAIRIVGIDTESRTPLSFRVVLSASFEGRRASAFIVPVVGKYGVYTALFLYEHTIGCKFCGLVGINALPDKAAYYGIAPATITMQQHKITRFMKRQAPHGT